jgi:hypothetical protein
MVLKTSLSEKLLLKTVFLAPMEVEILFGAVPITIGSHKKIGADRGNKLLIIPVLEIPNYNLHYSSILYM